MQKLSDLIKIQSVIRGFLTRKNLSYKTSTPLGKFLPYSEPDLPYVQALNPIITQSEISYVFSTYPPSSENTKLSLICINTIEYINGSQFYGEWNRTTNQKHGRGIQKWPEGPTYLGEFVNDHPCGRGKLIFKGGEQYEGDWEDGKANGFGKYKNKEVKYEGKWKDDKQEGIGTETWTDGTTYTGEFKNGKKTGQGKFKYVDGSSYNGGFLNNQLHGKGKYIWNDGREYNGEWKFNKIEGEGIFKWPDGRKYTGHYKENKKNGYGIFEWPNGKKYKGFWLNGKQNGEGERYNPKDKTWTKGIWKDGKRENSINNSYNANNSNKESNEQEKIKKFGDIIARKKGMIRNNNNYRNNGIDIGIGNTDNVSENKKNVTYNKENNGKINNC